MPAPVFSRRSFTSAAVIVAMGSSFEQNSAAPSCPAAGVANEGGAIRACKARRVDRGLAPGEQRQGRFTPRRSAPRAWSTQWSRLMRPLNLQVGVELVGLFGRHRGDLPIMEHAVLVELLDDLRADAGQLGEIVGRAARGGRAVRNARSRRSASASTGLGQDLGDRRLGRAEVDALPRPGCARCRRSRRARSGRNRAGSRGSASSLAGIG